MKQSKAQLIKKWSVVTDWELEQLYLNSSSNGGHNSSQIKQIIEMNRMNRKLVNKEGIVDLNNNMLWKKSKHLEVELEITPIEKYHINLPVKIWNNNNVWKYESSRSFWTSVHVS